MEVFTLELSFPHSWEDEKWSRVIEVKENFSLIKLHDYIQELVNFDDDHLYEFFIAKTPRNKLQTVPESKKLNEIYPITGYKLYYLFDFGDSWLFQIKKSRKRLAVQPNIKYPRLVKSVGTNPEQYPEYEE